jgi:hypothetical protein
MRPCGHDHGNSTLIGDHAAGQLAHCTEASCLASLSGLEVSTYKTTCGDEDVQTKLLTATTYPWSCRSGRWGTQKCWSRYRRGWSTWRSKLRLRDARSNGNKVAPTPLILVQPVINARDTPYGQSASFGRTSSTWSPFLINLKSTFWSFRNFGKNS